MKYPYIVNKNGVWYPAGAEVPEDTLPNKNVSDDATEKLPHNGYTKTDINRMSTTDLQALAVEQGMENAKELSGAELKKLLIEKFGL